MGSRGDLSRRRHAPIKLPPRPVIGAGTAAIQVASEWLAGPDGSPAGVASDLIVRNLQPREVEAKVSFEPAAGGSLPPVRLLLSPMESIVASDFVREWFGSAPQSGTVRLSPQGDAEMTVRSYVRDGDVEEAARFLPGLAETDALWTEIQAVNATASSESFTATLRTAAGATAGSREGLLLESGETRTWSLRELFPGALGRGMTVQLAADPGSASPAVLARITDSRTDSRMTIPEERVASRAYLPVNGRTDGFGDTFLTSDLVLANAGDSILQARIRFLQCGLDNTRQPSAVVALGAGETRTIEDALGALFGLSAVTGFLEVRSDQPTLVVSGRQMARSESVPGSVGASVASVGRASFSTRSVLRAAGSPATRSLSSVRLLNPEERPLAAELRWLDATGQVVAESSTLIPSLGTADIVANQAGAEVAATLVVESPSPHASFLLRTDEPTLGPGRAVPGRLVSR